MMMWLLQVQGSLNYQSIHIVLPPYHQDLSMLPKDT